MTSKTIWVFGAGAIGSVVAGKLRSTYKCVLVDAWPAHVEAIREDGLRVDYPDDQVRLHVPAFLEHELPEIPDRADIILLAVKANRTAECVRQLLPYISEDTSIVSLQNGVNEDLIASLIGKRRTVGAVVDFAAEMQGPGRARGHGLDYGLVVGELDGRITPRIEELAGMIEPTIPTEPTTEIWTALWSKLIVNAQLNPLCALTGLATDELAQNRKLRRLSLALAMEAVGVAVRLGITPKPDFLDGPLEVYLNGMGREAAMAELEPQFLDRWGAESFRPSMLQDIEKGRPTEIDSINGYVVAKGRAVGAIVSMNQAVIELITRYQSPRGRDPARWVADELSRLYAGYLE